MLNVITGFIIFIYLLPDQDFEIWGTGLATQDWDKDFQNQVETSQGHKRKLLLSF